MVRIKGKIAGKNLIAYTPKGGKKYSPEDIGKYLKKFQLKGQVGRP